MGVVGGAMPACAPAQGSRTHLHAHTCMPARLDSEPHSTDNPKASPSRPLHLASAARLCCCCILAPGLDSGHAAALQEPACLPASPPSAPGLRLWENACFWDGQV